MKKAIILAAAACLLLGCEEQWNDLVHTEVVANILKFDVEGQISSNISSKTVSILLPWDADLTALKVTEFSMTEGAVCTPDIKVGSTIDLTNPLTLTLHTYDDYVWTVTATLKPKPLSDIYNMSFDLWSPGILGGENCYGEGADSEQQNTWGSLSSYLSLAGISTMASEKSFVAVAGEGKAALKLLSQEVPMLSTFYGGCIFNGTIYNFETTTYTASCGVSFNKRPVALEGYACYQPKNIDCAETPYTDKMGTLDNGFVFVALTDWDAPYEATPAAKLLDVNNIPGIVAHGKVVFDHNMAAYEKFTVNLTYLNDHTPKYAVIIATSSALGDYHTGAHGSVLYLDELGFSY